MGVDRADVDAASSGPQAQSGGVAALQPCDVPPGNPMNSRPLKKIASEIAIALKREAKNVIEVGGLLTEAKEQLDEHGQWLPWLSENFSLSIRTAQNYMAASALAAKYATDAHLLLKVSGLYALVDADRDGNSEAVEAALCEAKVQWVGDDRSGRSSRRCSRGLARLATKNRRLAIC
jgi:Protein of unknown function (DUF3102)